MSTVFPFGDPRYNSLMKKLVLLSIVFVVMGAMVAQAAPSRASSTTFLPYLATSPAKGSWIVIESSGSPSPRHENGFAEVDGQFYLLGGRGKRPVDHYDPATNQWQERGATSDEMHHFQAVSLNGKIYVIGAWTGGFPYEDNIEKVIEYDPQTDRFDRTTTIPVDRQRGAAGSVAYNGKIYIVGGAVGGHGPHATTVPWFDVYDPSDGSWTVLPDAPHERDHFSVVVIGDNLYSVGGRISGSEDFSQNVVTAVDMYDFSAGQWVTLPHDVTYGRGGSMTGVMDGRLFLTGGEGFGKAWGETEWLLANDRSWQVLANLNVPRHASQLINYNGCLYVVGGAGTQGGAPELTVMERFAFNQTLCD